MIWEACQTMYETWGYDRDAHWKSSEMMTKMLIGHSGKRWELSLNIGPNARGEISLPTRSHLEAIGSWMHYHQQAIIGCGASSFNRLLTSRYTQNGNKLYLHLFSYPYKSLHLPGLAGRVKHIRFLHDGSNCFIEDLIPRKCSLQRKPSSTKRTLFSAYLSAHQMCWYQWSRSL